MEWLHIAFLRMELLLREWLSIEYWLHRNEVRDEQTSMMTHKTEVGAICTAACTLAVAAQIDVE